MPALPPASPPSLSSSHLTASTPSNRDGFVRGVLYFFALHVIAFIPNLMITSDLVKRSGANKETIAWAPVFGIVILAFSSLLYQIPLALYLAAKARPKAAKAVVVCAASFALLQALGYGAFYLWIKA